MRTIAPPISKLTLDIKISKCPLNKPVTDNVADSIVEMNDNPTIIEKNVIFRFSAEFFISGRSCLSLLKRHKKTREIALNTISIIPKAILFVNSKAGSITIRKTAIITIGIIDATVKK